MTWVVMPTGGQVFFYLHIHVEQPRQTAPACVTVRGLQDDAGRPIFSPVYNSIQSQFFVLTSQAHDITCSSWLQRHMHLFYLHYSSSTPRMDSAQVLKCGMLILGYILWVHNTVCPIGCAAIDTFPYV